METTTSTEGLLGLAVLTGLSLLATIIVILRMVGVRLRRRHHA